MGSPADQDSIEERVWETLKLKKSLFAGVFDSPTGEVSFAALGRKSILQAVKEIFAHQPGRPKPLIDQAVSGAVPAAAQSAAPQSTEFEQAAAGLIETGVRFLESLAGLAQKAPAGHVLSNLVSVDPRTNRPVLSIPLPESVDQDRLVRALSAVLGAFGRSSYIAKRRRNRPCHHPKSSICFGRRLRLPGFFTALTRAARTGVLSSHRRRSEAPRDPSGLQGMR